MDDDSLLQDWGRSQSIADLRCDWHIPSQAGLDELQNVFSTLVLEELEYLDTHQVMERENLERRLRILNECIKGASLYMPSIEGDPYHW